MGMMMIRMLLYAKTYRKENENTRERRVTEQVNIR